MKQLLKLHIVMLLLSTCWAALVTAQEAVSLSGLPTCSDQHKSKWIGYYEIIFDGLPDMYDFPWLTSDLIHPGMAVHPPRQHPAVLLMGPECDDKFVWWFVEFEDTGNMGWIVEQRVPKATPVGQRHLPPELLQAPSASPTPQPSPTPSIPPPRQLTSAALGDVLFEESFDNNNNGWFVSNEISIRNGAINLQLSGRNAPLFTNTSIDFPLYEPYQLSFDIFDGDCSTRCALEILFNVRLNSRGELVHNRIEYHYGSPYGRNVGLAIWRGFADDNLRRRFETEDRRAVKVNVFDGAKHTVKIIVDEGQTTLLINDLVISTLYSRIVPIGGNIGFGINRRDQGSTARIAFDNVRITHGAGTVGTSLTAESSLPLNKTVIAHNLGIAIPIPETWQSIRTGNSFSFNVGRLSSGNELVVSAEFNASRMFDARTVQDVARTSFTSGVGTFTSIELNGVEMLKADIILQNEVRGAAFVRKMRDNYFLIFLTAASSRQHWLDSQTTAYAVISGIRIATDSELRQNQPQLAINNLANGRNINVGGFSMTLPEHATASPSPLSLVTGLANMGTGYDIRNSTAWDGSLRF